MHGSICQTNRSAFLPKFQAVNSDLAGEVSGGDVVASVCLCLKYRAYIWAWFATCNAFYHLSSVLSEQN
jgi:hypothetical protein